MPTFEKVVVSLDDILDPAPALVTKPVRPVTPIKPQPPRKPGKYVPTQDNLTKAELQEDKELHKLAVEAYEQQLQQHTANSSPAWVDLKTANTQHRYVCAQYVTDQALYDAYIAAKDKRKVAKIIAAWYYDKHLSSLCDEKLFGPEIWQVHFPDEKVVVDG